ncbi:2398_t:CDS:2 [Diversispora eburnea]|uniref:2398_t:CDS:1 n=1 Tax=Diversispora eburnea TaxID=1213867 RepID=A0A9N8VG57_9GLOM|nr:2398_t:CDS:2 [Diversispora eburnea]
MNEDYLRKRTVGISIEDDSSDSSVDLSDATILDRGKKQSRLSRILTSLRWIVVSGVIYWFFEVSSNVQQVLSLKGNTSKPNYKVWNQDETLKKFIPIATLTGVIGVSGFTISCWFIWGVFSPLVVLNLIIPEKISANNYCHYFSYPSYPSGHKNITKVKCDPLDRLDSFDSSVSLESYNVFTVDFHCGINNTNLCQKAHDVFKSAGNRIASIIKFNTPLKVNATFTNFCKEFGQCSYDDQILIGEASAAQFIPIKDSDGVIRHYSQALVKQLGNPDNAQYNDYDILASFNSQANLYFKGDSSIGDEQYDFEYVVTHEYIHGLGFYPYWNDYANLLTPYPEFLAEVNNTEQEITFTGFVETAFDRHMVLTEPGEASQRMTKLVDKFNSIVPIGTTLKVNDFFIKYENSEVYGLSKQLLKDAVTPKTMSFITSDNTSVLLETRINPYAVGSSICHVDRSYQNGSDFLMAFSAIPGKTLDELIAQNHGTSALGPNLIKVLGTLGYTQCYDYPNPIDRTYKVPVQCPITKQSSIDHLTSNSNSTNMFVVTFTCDAKNKTLCSKVKNAFDIAGKIITSILSLNAPINVNASYLDFCAVLGQCEGNPGLITLGGAAPTRTIPLQDDDGLVRLYPQSLVKQFQFKQHPQFGTFDITALFNSAGTDFWFQGDPKIKPEQQDFLYVVLHEMMHGLGLASNWDDYINDTPESLTPEISLSMSDGLIKFNGFFEAAFDKYLIQIPTGKRTSLITDQLNSFANGKGSTFSNSNDFITQFKSSSQYSLAVDMMKNAVNSNSLGFLPRGGTNFSDLIILETSLNPYQPGSSVSHLDHKTYNSTSDFLMIYIADRGIDVDTLLSDNKAQSPIGPKLKILLETMGYASPDNPNPYRPTVTITQNKFNPKDFNGIGPFTPDNTSTSQNTSINQNSAAIRSSSELRNLLFISAFVIYFLII